MEIEPPAAVTCPLRQKRPQNCTFDIYMSFHFQQVYLLSNFKNQFVAIEKPRKCLSASRLSPGHNCQGSYLNIHLPGKKIFNAQKNILKGIKPTAENIPSSQKNQVGRNRSHIKRL